MDIPKDFLSKEFLSLFKTGEDVTAFMKELHTRVYEQVPEAEMGEQQDCLSISPRESSKSTFCTDSRGLTSNTVI